ncbi:hypothetical protein GUITHDRAFT_155842, partial [Guillardia theta CCMP2712]
VIPARESMEVKIVMQPLKDLPSSTTAWKDKFLVQSAITTNETGDAKSVFENMSKDETVDQKLVCTFTLPSDAASGREQESSASKLSDSKSFSPLQDASSETPGSIRSFNEEAKTGSEEEPHTKHSNRASTADQEKLREEQNRCDRLVGSLKEFLE